MKPQVDPCEDFSQFACGGFVNGTSVYESTETDLISQITQMIQRKHNPGDFETDKKVRDFYMACNNFYNHFDGKVYVSFSGGKDSTVLFNIVRSMYPEVPAVFVFYTGMQSI